jgi:type IV pilus assembly protein PilB
MGPEMLKGIRAFKGKGCSSCNGTGKSGRTGVYEVMPITSAIEEMILKKAADSAIRKVAIDEGMFSLRMSAVEKMKLGMISIDEVFAVTGTN